MIGQSIGRYTITDKLGEGGMGVVYRATDTKLDRIVALKFLPPQASEKEETKARFLQEAKAAAALNHPGICTIYGVEEVDDKMFIVMEYVDGGTLRKQIDGQHLTPDNSVGLAVSIGEALHEAHAKGIVHRDIKADNVMLNARGEAKIMDFGLAKLKGTLKLTRTSSTVGTLAYMAPEQIQGGNVDARSDIFAFGVLLFEMLTGKLPFRGEHEAAMMYSLLNEAPEPLTAFLPDASSELTHVLNRALEKDPNDRYQTVEEMVIDLRRLKRDTSKVYKTGPFKDAPSPAPSSVSTRSAEPSPARTTSVTINIPALEKKPTAIIAGIVALVVVVIGLFYLLGDADPEGRIPIAVADFVNETNEPELNSLSGMLITSLEQSNRLSVATRARMFDILKQIGKGDVDRIDESLGKEIAQQASIDALVTASIRKFGKLYTIDLKVLDTRSNEYLFTAKEEGEGQESIPGLIDALAEETRANLRLPVAGSEDVAKVANVTTTNMEAYAHYFRGEDHINKIKMDEAAVDFQKAIDIDPEFALAYYRLGYALSWRQKDELARPQLEKAMELIDRIPAREQYLLRSHLLDLNGDPAGAVKLLKEAELRFPQVKEIPYEIGDIQFHQEKSAESIRYLEKVLAMDPTFWRALEHLAWDYRTILQFDKMKSVAERYTQVSDTTEAHSLLFQAYCGLKEYDNAIRVLENPKAGFSSGQIASRRSLVQLLRGEYDSALKIMEEALRASSTPREMRSATIDLAGVLPFLGRYRDTYSAYDRASELSWTIGDTNLAMYYRVRKAIALWFGRRPVEEARKEVQSTLEHADAVSYPPYFGFRSMLGAMTGDTSEAYTITRIPGIPAPFTWWIHAHLAMGEDDPDRALAFLDSVSVNGLPDLAVSIDALYLKGRTLMATSSYDAAIRTFKDIEGIPTNGYGLRAYILPASYNLLGQAYEKIGDRRSARASYEKLLAMWKDADPDLPVLKDTKQRLAALK